MPVRLWCRCSGHDASAPVVPREELTARATTCGRSMPAKHAVANAVTACLSISLSLFPHGAAGAAAGARACLLTEARAASVPSLLTTPAPVFD
eukprot:365172-Chlamydomonas_euryale.AAC.3